MIYLREGDFDRAMTIFEKLAKLGDDEAELRAFGLAGKCGVLSIRGKYRGVERRARSTLADPRQTDERADAELVDHAVKKNRSELGLQTAPEWDKWFEEQFRDGG